MPRPKTQIGPCTVEGCERPKRAQGLCQKHYNMRHVHGRLEKVNTGEKRSHPLYSIWFERKQRDSLCEAWANDFWAFVAGVGARPSPTHLLRPLRAGEQYSPSNFEWLAALKREPGESVKAFNARKWQARRERFPTYEAHRGIKRKYGITPEEYAAMLAAQGGVCAICREDEKVIDPKTHAPKLLAVDHCHESLKVRGLLCWRCNTSIGKFNHDPMLLRTAALYCEETA